jgi:molybdate transport system permease protein
MEWNAIFLTFKLALVVCAVLLTVGMPIASWLASTDWRWKFLVEAVVALPLVLPPTVLGFYVLVAMGPNSPVGQLYRHLFGHGLAFTFTGLVIASIIYSLPFAVQPMAAAFAQVDRNLLNASSILGASRLRTFFRIVLPLSTGGVITAAVLSFAHTLGEFGVVLMVGGNIPGVTQTISIAIYDHVQALDYSGANRMALLLLAFSFVTLSLTYGVNRRMWAVWPSLHR